MNSILEEKNGCFILPKEDLILPDVNSVKISERSGSLQLTIPSEIIQKLGWKKGDLVKYIVNKKHGFAILILKEKLEGTEVNLPLFGKTSFESNISLDLYSKLSKNNK